MTVTIARRPLNDVRQISQMLDEAVSNWPFGTGPAWSVTSAWLPSTDIIEDQDGLKLVVELPGLKPEDVKLTIENNTLTIRGEKKQEVDEREGKVHRVERSYGVFERSFTLPNTVDTDKVDAKFANGVLTITLPKADKAKPRQIAVKG
jgi:HSP20 family protein